MNFYLNQEPISLIFDMTSILSRGGRIAHFTSELIKSGLMMLKNFRVDHRQG